MRCHQTSKSPKSECSCIANLPIRYEIEEGAPGWADAEKQVLSAARSGQKNPVVSVKSAKQKREAGETAADIYEAEMGEKAHKKVKKTSKKNKL